MKYQTKTFVKPEDQPSDMTNILVSDEGKITAYVCAKKEDQDSYDLFLSDLKTFLEKISAHNIKKYVGNVIEKEMIFMGQTKTNRKDLVFCRVSFDGNKLSGITLDVVDFEINIYTGECARIDDAVYASYFALVRAAVLCNRPSLLKDIKLQKLASSFLFISFLKAMTKGSIYSDKQKQIMHYMVLVLFYKYFFRENLTLINNKIREEYSDVIDPNIINDFNPTQVKVIDSYNSIKDIPKLFNDFSLIKEPPNVVLSRLLSLFGPYGYSSLNVFDYFIAMIVLSQYPLEFFPKTISISPAISSSIEKIMAKYLDNLEYSLSEVKNIRAWGK